MLFLGIDKMRTTTDIAICSKQLLPVFCTLFCKSSFLQIAIFQLLVDEFSTKIQRDYYRVEWELILSPRWVNFLNTPLFYQGKGVKFILKWWSLDFASKNRKCIYFWIFCPLGKEDLQIVNINCHHHWKKCPHFMKFLWSVDNIFMLSVLIFEKNVVRIFFLWNADNIFRLSVFSRSYLHQYLENKCCPHFILMKCGQHFKLSACCPVVRSCSHFINTRCERLIRK